MDISDDDFGDAGEYPVVKIVVLGSTGVGKTSIIKRYTQNIFEECKPTINAAYFTKKIQMENEETVLICIWDTAGQERFTSLAPLYFRQSKGAILVYDVSNEDSFAKMQFWFRELEQKGPENIRIAIAANKIDTSFALQKQIPSIEAEKFAEKIGSQIFLTSAKTGKGVDDLFAYFYQTCQDVNLENKQKSKKNQSKKISEKNQSKKRNDNNINNNNNNIDEKSKEKSNCC
ncbi:ras-related protein rab-5c [Anaeramoeba ignava]|uniref:Ras-related protein rab-5c n=1 Tax=Anaeramoeba ignava TaxID=1746090 RepID=A0A9Q0R6W9_ANAIG|nr:ras-related protein rab-5c [Anaeramoeba ignava]